MIPAASLLSWASGALVFSLMFGLAAIGAAFSSPRGYDLPAKALCRLLVRCFRMRVRVSGLEGLDQGRPYVFLANHVNILDGFLLYGHLPWVFRGLELASHFRWPVYGLFIRLFGNIPVDASDHRLSARGLGRAERALRKGISILVLPEGHRTRDGRLGGFGRGAFRLAVNSGVDVVPVVMAGAFQAMRTGSMRITPGPVRLMVGRCFPARQCASAGEKGLRELARARMLEMLRQA